MGHMTPHEVLINTLSSTVLNLVPSISSPVAPSGVLIELDYKIRLPEFGEAVKELLKKKGAKIPDLLLVNEKKKLLIIVECKSDFSLQTQEKLSEQIEFYSSEDFKAISKALFKEFENLEIWVFTYKNFSNKISEFVKVKTQQTKKLANIVVWDMELRKAGEEAEIAKAHGRHYDTELNQMMETTGLRCSPPQVDLLIDPTLTYPERVYRIGRRILAFMASTYLTEQERTISINNFKEKHLDAIISDHELKKCFRYLITLAPEIGQYSSATSEIALNKRPSLNKIKTRLETIQKMTDVDFKTELAKLGKKIPRFKIKKPKPEKYTLEPWLKKGNPRKYDQVQVFPALVMQPITIHTLYGGLRESTSFPLSLDLSAR